MDISQPKITTKLALGQYSTGRNGYFPAHSPGDEWQLSV